MKDWKIIAIIAATAIATAAAVVILLQKQNNKRKMRFDSEEFDDDYMDDYPCGEQCVCCGEDLDVELPSDDTAEAPAPTAEEAAAFEELLVTEDETKADEEEKPAE